MLVKPQKRNPARSIEAGKVNTQAMSRLRTVPHCKPGMIRRHRAGDTGGKHVGRAHRKAEPIRRADGHHRGNFRGRALSVGQVVLADFFSDGHHDALPAHHRAQPQRHGDRNLHPERG